MTKKTAKRFSWLVWNWNFTSDALVEYDVVPVFLRALKAAKKADRPKTKGEFGEFLRREAAYCFRAKCEYEMIVHGWPRRENDEKVDAYQQLRLNWDAFVEAFWKSKETRKLTCGGKRSR